MLLGPEHGLTFVIKCPTVMRCLPQMAPTASREYLYCLPRVPVLALTSTCCLPRLPQLRGGSWKSTGVIFGVSNGCEARQREPEICFMKLERCLAFESEASSYNAARSVQR
jgi:hypothetical protein